MNQTQDRRPDSGELSAPNGDAPQALSLTEAAAVQIRKLLAQESFAPGAGMLRLKVVGGGCSGYSYDMYMDDESQEGDIVSESLGVRLVTDAMSLSFLEGTEIDYQETLTQSGFKFQNPKAQDTCGCGISFSA